MNQEIKNKINLELSSISIEQYEKFIQEVNDPKTTEHRIQEIIQKFVSVIGFVTLPVGQSNLYRARIWNGKTELPREIKQLLEPLAKDCRLNRCNLEGKPVLYITSHPASLVHECHFKTGDIFTLMQWNHVTTEKELDTLLLGVDFEQKFGEDQRVKDMVEFRKAFFETNYPKVIQIERLLHTQFVRDDDSEGITYRFTANLCDYYFEKIKDLDCISYPSIATSGMVSNTAIRPNTYGNCYQPSKIGLFETIENSEIRQLMGAEVSNNVIQPWNSSSKIDMPNAARLVLTDINDPRIYKAPWRK